MPVIPIKEYKEAHKKFKIGKHLFSFILEGWSNTKKEANERAESIRRKGYYVRVVEITARGKKVHATFLRKRGK